MTTQQIRLLISDFLPWQTKTCVQACFEDLRRCSKTFDYYQFLLRFGDKIVGVELLYHVCSEVLDGTPHSEKFRQKSPTILSVIASRCEASGRDFCFLICVPIFPQVIGRFHCLPSCTDLSDQVNSAISPLDARLSF